MQTVNVKSLGDAEEVRYRARLRKAAMCANVHECTMCALLAGGALPSSQRPGRISTRVPAMLWAASPMPPCPILLSASPPRPAPSQTDGERLPLAVKDLGSSDIYPQSLQHSPNGRFVTVRPRLAGPVPAA